MSGMGGPGDVIPDLSRRFLCPGHKRDKRDDRDKKTRDFLVLSRPLPIPILRHR